MNIPQSNLSAYALKPTTLNGNGAQGLPVSSSVNPNLGAQPGFEPGSEAATKVVMDSLVSHIQGDSINVTDSDTMKKARTTSRILKTDLAEYGINPENPVLQNPKLASRVLGVVAEAQEKQIDLKQETLKGLVFGTVGGLIGFTIRTLLFEFQKKRVFFPFFVGLGAIMGGLSTYFEAKKKKEANHAAVEQQLQNLLLNA